MDRIIWDEQALANISSQLRNAAMELERCLGELNTSSNMGAEILQKDVHILREFQNAQRRAIRSAEEAIERAEHLCKAITKAKERFMETEAALAEGARRNSGIPATVALDPKPGRGIIRVHYTDVPDRFAGIVPMWIRQAANRRFP